MLRNSLILSLSMTVVMTAAASGDVVTLRSGGALRGSVLFSNGALADPSDEATVTIKTLSGARITVPKADVATTVQRPRVEEEYETRVRDVADSVEAQWELAEWCRRNRLEDRQRKHLEAVIALEPDHETARSELGYVLRDGAWVKRAEIMRERGLVRHERRWVTPQERDLIIQTEARREQEQAWYSKIRLWHGWLTSGVATRSRKAVDELRRVRDPTAIPALAKYFSDDPNETLRILYVGVLKRIPGSTPVGPLVTQYLHDVAPVVRDAAFQALTAEHLEDALPYLLEGLRNDNNKVVRRAGAALEQVGDERAVPDLIKALITAHGQTIQMPERIPTTTFSSNGAYGPAGIPLPPEIELALRTGHLPYGVGIHTSEPTYRMRTVAIRVNQENQEVLEALQKITGESFGFDERIWQQWWVGKKSGL